MQKNFSLSENSDTEEYIRSGVGCSTKAPDISQSPNKLFLFPDFSSNQFLFKTLSNI